MYKRQLMISIPNEPFFTLCRFLHWEEKHLWAITPKIMKQQKKLMNKHTIYLYYKNQLGYCKKDALILANQKHDKQKHKEKTV